MGNIIMKRKIFCILVWILMFSSAASVMSSANISIKPTDPEPRDRDYSHNILGEYFTQTTCVPCKYAHSALRHYTQVDGIHFIILVLFLMKTRMQKIGRKN